MAKSASSPQNPLLRSRKKQIERLLLQDDLAGARSQAEAALRSHRMDADLWVTLALIHRRSGRHADAEQAARQALMANPAHAAAYCMLGSVLHCQGRANDAYTAYRQSLQIEPRTAEPHYLLANLCKDLARNEEALAYYRLAIELRPDYLEALGNLATLLIVLGKSGEAIPHLNRAIAIKPDSPQLLMSVGSILEQEGKFELAALRYTEAARAAPTQVDPIAKLAALKEKMYHLDETQALVERGLALSPDHFILNMTAVKLARNAKRYEDALAILERLRALPHPAAEMGDLLINLGKLYDQTGNCEKAFACLADGNRLVAQTMVAGEEDFLSHVATQRSDFHASCMNLSPSPLPVEPSPAFLFGFPRSGTTLLEQILDSHPDIQGLEEKPTIARVLRELPRITAGRPHPLATLTANELRELRLTYYAEVDRHLLRRPGALIVDKMPLDTVQAHLIWRLFPNAKVILAIRHPCDAVLSCFMQNFSLNRAMSTFYELSSTAEVYASVMGLWQEYIAKLPIDYHRIRYEDVVANLEGEARRLIAFLGVPWSDVILRHHEHTRKNSKINTPSYHQVSQPIYRQARYRWKRYETQMAPVLPVLRPFISYYDYTE